jgi:hypothetical protein
MLTYGRIETYRKLPERTGGPATISTFVYAVPKGAAETPADQRLREAAEVILREYRSRRSRAEAAGTNHVALFREWLTSRDGRRQ